MSDNNNGLCRNCGQPLMVMPMAGGYYLVCDNARERCHLFRERQGCVANESKMVTEATSYHIRHDIGNPARKVFGGSPIAGGTPQSLRCSRAMPSYLVHAYFGQSLGGINE